MVQPPARPRPLSDEMNKRSLLPLALLCLLSLAGFRLAGRFVGGAGGVRSTETSSASAHRDASVDDDDDDPIHVLITVCNGGDVAERRSMVRYSEAADLLVSIRRYGSIRADARCGNRPGCAVPTDDDGIVVHVFADDVTALRGRFLDVPPASKWIDPLDVRLHDMPPPESGAGHDYDRYRACASSRLYAPHLFEASHNRTGGAAGGGTTGIDDVVPERVLYLDTDARVTAPLRTLWDASGVLFERRPAALFAMVQECVLTKEMGPYFRGGYAGEDVAGPDGTSRRVYLFPNGTCQGYNSGVMVAHLGRWRRDDFAGMVVEQERHASQNGYRTAFGDQGILNALAARHPETHLELPCYWNLRTDNAKPCWKSYRENGGGVVHGNRGIFHRAPGSGLHARLVGNGTDGEGPGDLTDLLFGIFRNGTG